MDPKDQQSTKRILAAYEPQEVSLEPASGKGKLGNDVSRPIQALDPNIVPSKIIHRETLDVGVVGMVERVAYGEYNTRPACLIVFSFSLKSGKKGLFFRNANFKLTFEKCQPASDQGDPAVVAFAPRKIYGMPTEESRKITYNVELGVTASAGPISMGPKGSRSVESSFEKIHIFKTVGNRWSSKKSNAWDIVYWEMTENGKQRGIPDRLNAAVIIESSGPFQAKAEVTVDTSIKDNLLGAPWQKTHPVPFTPGITKGTAPRTLKFEDLTESDWKEMIPYELEGEVSRELLASQQPKLTLSELSS